MEEAGFFYYLTPGVSVTTSRRTWDDEDLSYYTLSTEESYQDNNTNNRLAAPTAAEETTRETETDALVASGNKTEIASTPTITNIPVIEEREQQINTGLQQTPSSAFSDYNSIGETSSNNYNEHATNQFYNNNNQKRSIPFPQSQNVPSDTTKLLLPPMNGSVDYSNLKVTPMSSASNSRHGLNESSHHSLLGINGVNAIFAGYNGKGGFGGGKLTPTLERSDSFFKPLSRKNSSFFEPISRRASSFIEPFNDHTGAPKSVIAGLFNLTVVGTIIGVLMPQNETLPTPWYRLLSSITGYCYFIFWCASFYPQVVMNFQRKSTDGLSIDYSVINFFGYICYTAYTASFYWSDSVKRLYQERHYDPSTPDDQQAESTVESNDVAFAIHSLIMSIIWLVQLQIYGGFDKCRKQKKKILSRPIESLIYMIVGSCTVYATLILLYTSERQYHIGTTFPESALAIFNWLDYLYYLSYMKVLITVAKYIPQVLLNMKRKSCVGWNIWNILLDIAGGILSLIQLVGDAIDLNDLSSISGNMAKLGLSAVSIFFDVSFVSFFSFVQNIFSSQYWF